jgi:L-fuconolactonase
MFGTDWPVCLLRTKYSEWVETFRSLTNDLSEEERVALHGVNAEICYRLS